MHDQPRLNNVSRLLLIFEAGVVSQAQACTIAIDETMGYDPAVLSNASDHFATANLTFNGTAFTVFAPVNAAFAPDALARVLGKHLHHVVHSFCWQASQVYNHQPRSPQYSCLLHRFCMCAAQLHQCISPVEVLHTNLSHHSIII